MTNFKRYLFAIMTFILSVVGYSKLANSVETGKNRANNYLSTRGGGSMASEDFGIHATFERKTPKLDKPDYRCPLFGALLYNRHLSV